MELPKVYASPIDKEIDNVQKEFRGVKEDREPKVNLNVKINNLFKDPSFVYKKKVLIKTKDMQKIVTIVGKTSDCLLTMNNEKIKINDIYDLEIQ